MDWSLFDPFIITEVNKTKQPRLRSPYLKRCKKCGQNHCLKRDDPCPFEGVLQYHRIQMITKPKGWSTSREEYIKPCRCGKHHIGKERDTCMLCDTCQEYHTPGSCSLCRVCGEEGCFASKCTKCVMCKEDHHGVPCEAYCVRCGHLSHKGTCECLNCQQSGHTTAQCPRACRNCHKFGHLVTECPINKCKQCGSTEHTFNKCELSLNPCSNCGQVGHNVEMCFVPCCVCRSNNHVNFQCTQEYRKQIHRETRKTNRKIKSTESSCNDLTPLLKKRAPSQRTSQPVQVHMPPPPPTPMFMPPLPSMFFPPINGTMPPINGAMPPIPPPPMFMPPPMFFMPPDTPNTPSPQYFLPSPQIYPV